MGNQFNANVQVRISEDQTTLIIEKNGVPAFVSVGLIKYMLDIPYTRNDGTLVSLRDIQAMKDRNNAKLEAPPSKPLIVSRA